MDIISLISGAVGGNIAAAVLRDQNLGTVGNSIAGILGGGIGAVFLQAGRFHRSGRPRHRISNRQRR